jgi:hypothetical protein
MPEVMYTEILVPKECLPRRIDAAVDFKQMYEVIGDLYCKDNGRPSINPAVLFEIMLIRPRPAWTESNRNVFLNQRTLPN